MLTAKESTELRHFGHVIAFIVDRLEYLYQHPDGTHRQRFNSSEERSALVWGALIELLAHARRSVNPAWGAAVLIANPSATSFSFKLILETVPLPESVGARLMRSLASSFTIGESGELSVVFQGPDLVRALDSVPLLR